MKHKITYTDNEDGSLTIRLQNKYGFRWFKSDTQINRCRKIREAIRIENEIQNNVFGKYYGVCPILIK
jgi:hypothetical protein